MGVEPTTTCLGSKVSTTELRPLFSLGLAFLAIYGLYRYMFWIDNETAKVKPRTGGRRSNRRTKS